jgi:hypothetical protein
LLDSFNQDAQVKVSFNLRGRKWEKDGQTSYFTNLDAWRIEGEQSTNTTSDPQNIQDSVSPDETGAPFPTEPPPDNDSEFDDLPF